MKKIVVLPEEISQKIAAGEVIERPFSVVKELVENSLDAEATEVNVELIAGGKALIRVQDNGHGMSPEDAEVCFERHSTSKITREEDLYQISTLGFRGEALPSISAVSHLILKTNTGKGDRGTLIERQGEKVIRASDIAFPRGTSIEVRDLFFNFPARKKFLRSERAEFSRIVKYLTVVALAYPEVRFSLRHGKREVFNYPPVSTLRERIFQVYGKSILERLLDVDYRENQYHVNGHSSRPPHGWRNRSHQLFFVNRRPVSDKTLQAALNQAYKGVLEKDYFAEAFLLLFVPPSEVDVNVHPAKAEVRFKDSQKVFRQIVRGLESALLKEKGVKPVYPTLKDEAGERRIEEPGKTPPFYMPSREKRWQEAERKELFPPVPGVEEAGPRVLGQYLDTYIVASDEEGVLIIDQHNAHERVLFERYKEIDSQREWPRKIPLVPILFDLSPSQILILETSQELLEETGFRVEPMGGKTYALKEFPDIFKQEEAKSILFSLLEEVKQEKAENRRNKVLATLACKTAIKAGETLPLEKMRYLVEELFKIPQVSVCPHGRPILLRVEKKEIERGLKRSGN